MFASPEILLVKQILSKLVLTLIITLINGSVLFVFTSVLVRRLKKVPARFKHLIWFFIICCFTIIPVLSIFTPPFDLPFNKIPVEKVLAHRESGMYTIDEVTGTTQIATSSTGVTPVDRNMPVPIISWHMIALSLWLAGIFVYAMRIVRGRIGLFHMVKNSTPAEDKRYYAMVRSISNRFEIGSNIQLWISRQCITPFTCYLFKPIILLPGDVHRWSDEHLRVVLLHELAHIKRRDHITRCIARMICTVFWFVPPIWIVYKNLHIEEEKTCDALVVHSGTSAADYAGHIIDISRRMKCTVLLMDLHHFVGNKSTLEIRIRNILSLKGRKESSRIGKLIRIILMCFVFVMMLQMVNPVSARNSIFLKKEAPVEPLYGRWVNDQLDYSKWINHQGDIFKGKLIIDSDGTIHNYQTPDCPEGYDHVGQNARFKVTESYMDREGNYLYEVYTVWCPGFVGYNLWRLDSSGTMLEGMYDYSDYPIEIQPGDFRYFIFYRQ